MYKYVLLFIMSLNIQAHAEVGYSLWCHVLYGGESDREHRFEKEVLFEEMNCVAGEADGVSCLKLIIPTEIDRLTVYAAISVNFDSQRVERSSYFLSFERQITTGAFGSPVVFHKVYGADGVLSGLGSSMNFHVNRPWEIGARKTDIVCKLKY